MRPHILLYIFYLCLCAANGQKKCPKQRDKIEPGRKCRNKCKTSKSCGGKSEKVCHCDDVCGMSCINKDLTCEELAPIKNGKIEGNVYTYGSNIQFVCDKGYTLVGTSTRTCRSDKKWSGKAPSCVPGCSKPEAIGVSFAVVLDEISSVGTKVEYKCRFGYKLVGNPESKCLENREWSKPEHDCIIISCGKPKTPNNGYVEGEFTFGSYITYRCNDGYVIDNPKTVRRYCSVTGNWQGTPRTCNKLKCEKPVAPENGYIDGEIFSLEFQTIIEYRCNNGYRIEGNSRGECNENGTWGEVPVCAVDVNCDFDALLNDLCGYTNEGRGQWKRHFLRENTLDGAPSYVLRANSAPAILRSPAVVSSEPQCFQFYYYIKKLVNEDSFTIWNVNRDTILGRLELRESRNEWLSQQITVHSEKNGDSIQFEIRLSEQGSDIDLDKFSLAVGECETNCPENTCKNDGICIDRIDKFKCLCTSFYKGRRCQTEKLCPPLRNIAFGEVSIPLNDVGHRPGTIASFSCIEGYKLIKGSRTITCGFDEKWSDGRIPVCEEILCSSVAHPIGGTRKINSPQKGKMNIRTVVTFECPIGYYLVRGPKVIVCKSDGSWSSTQRPECEEKKLDAAFSQCPLDYVQHGATCYRVYNEERSYKEAASICSSQDAHIAIIRSTEESERVYPLLTNMKTYFVGASNIGEKVMKWSDGEPVSKVRGMNYEESLIKQREDISTKPGCAALYRFSATLSFFSSACYSRQYFLCQTFRLEVKPLLVKKTDKLQNEIDGLFTPLAGLTYRSSPVYKKTKGLDIYIYKSETGWEIGSFDETVIRPKKDDVFFEIDSNAVLPQNIEGTSWVRSSTSQEKDEAKIKITVYDQYGSWSKWNACSKTCGGGTQKRSRQCEESKGKSGFGNCKGPAEERKACNEKKCIITRWANWEGWSDCSKPCGGGEKTRRRECIRDPEGSERCQGDGSQRKLCSTQKCGPETSDWFKNPDGGVKYKIISKNSITLNQAKKKCEKLNGTLANVNPSSPELLLRDHIKALHCESISKFKEWRIWIAILEEPEDQAGSRFDSELSHMVTEKPTKYTCLRHSCTDGIVSDEARQCDDDNSTGYICEKDVLPCESSPCKNNAQCIDKNATSYECNCPSTHTGGNCEVEIRCDLSEVLKKFAVRKSSDKSSGMFYVVEGEKVQLGCKNEKKNFKDKKFTCVGMNRWKKKEVPEIECGTECIVPNLNDTSITIYNGKEVVKSGYTFHSPSVLSFKCPNNSNIVGNASVKCTKAGWNASFPETCSFFCKTIVEPPNGILSYGPKPTTYQIKPGTMVELNCNENYTSVGEKSSECNEYGIWTPEIGSCKEFNGCDIDLPSWKAQSVWKRANGSFIQFFDDVIEKGEKIYLICQNPTTFPEFQCIGRNRWDDSISDRCE